MARYLNSKAALFVAPDRVSAFTQGSEDATDGRALLAIAERNKRVK
jgi:hypothetical protein